MTTTFNWTIAQLDRNAADGFVTTVHYRVDAADGEITAGAYGTIGYEPRDSFKPYDQLTKDEVVNWVKESLGEDTVQDALEAQIDAQKQPKTASGLPW